MPLRRTGWAAARCGLALAFAVTTANAQLLNPDDPSWKEGDVPPPPAFRMDKLVGVEVNLLGSLKYGIDPATISVGKDRVLRYVIVAYSSSGAMTAMYEALRCVTGEAKTYARYNDSKWTPIESPQWQSVFEQRRFNYQLAVARQGGCDNTAPPSSVNAMVERLKAPSPAERVP